MKRVSSVLAVFICSGIVFFAYTFSVKENNDTIQGESVSRCVYG